LRSPAFRATPGPGRRAIPPSYARQQTGAPTFSEATKNSKAHPDDQTEQAGKENQEVGEDESYVLEVSPTGAKLTARTPMGTMHGLQTFLQLVNVSPTVPLPRPLHFMTSREFPGAGS